MKRTAALIACLAVSVPALAAVGQPDSSRSLAAQYASWAGGKSNADALIAGMQNGTTVMLVTPGPNNSRSLAGFTPTSRMSNEEIATALARAKSTLAGLGIRQPTADQIQAALIGGEVTLSDGRTRMVAGPVGLLPENAVPVASR
jgi:hypothetical protein